MRKNKVHFGFIQVYVYVHLYANCNCLYVYVCICVYVSMYMYVCTGLRLVRSATLSACSARWRATCTRGCPQTQVHLSPLPPGPSRYQSRLFSSALVPTAKKEKLIKNFFLIFMIRKIFDYIVCICNRQQR